MGLATGLVVALFPFAAIGGGLLLGATVGGALLGSVAGHAAAGMSRHDLKELGEQLDKGQAGLVVVGVADMEARVDEAMNRLAGIAPAQDLAGVVRAVPPRRRSTTRGSRSRGTVLEPAAGRRRQGLPVRADWLRRGRKANELGCGNPHRVPGASELNGAERAPVDHPIDGRGPRGGWTPLPSASGAPVTIPHAFASLA